MILSLILEKGAWCLSSRKSLRGLLAWLVSWGLICLAALGYLAWLAVRALRDGTSSEQPATPVLYRLDDVVREASQALASEEVL